MITALIAVALVGITVPIARRAARRESDPLLARLLMAAVVLKLASALVRDFVAFEVYGGAADASTYHRVGADLARSFRAGDFGLDMKGSLIGTNFVEVVTGVVYSVIGPRRVGGFLVFAWMGFLGLYWFYRAFRVGCPDGDGRRYALLVFFLPSLLFWSSSIGKEAWMTLTIGLVAYGAARVLTGAWSGVVALGLGLLGAVMVRPHVALLVMPGLIAALLLRRSPEGRGFSTALVKLVGVAALLGASALLVGRAEQFLGNDLSNRDSIEEARREGTRRTAEAGSSFEADPVRSPADLPAAAISLLFRPFPTEAHNTQSLIASAEGMVLLGVFILSWRRLLGLPRTMLRRPYVAFAMVYSVLFIYAFSGFANFGILTRERVQLFPLVLMALALPRKRAPTWPEPEPDSERSAPAPLAPASHRPIAPGAQLEPGVARGGLT